LLALSSDGLLALVEVASEGEVGRLWDLIPERLADLPIRSTFGKSLPPGAAEVAFSMPLRFLFYPPSRQGVEQFQADIGAKITGELTMRQFTEVHRRWLRKNDTPVYSSDLDVQVNDDLGVASARGTWLTDDNDTVTVTPINVVEITCDRGRQECLRATAELYVPSLDGDRSRLYLGPDDDSYLLRLAPIRRYRIVSWSDGEVTALENRGCDVALLTLNRQSSRVQEVVRNDENIDPNCRNPSPPFEKPRIARLASGWATGRGFWGKRQEMTRSYVNPRAAEEMKEEIKQALGTAEPRDLPDSAAGPSSGTQPTLMELLEHIWEKRQAPLGAKDQ
jgi:hypothetical protein